MAIENLPRPWVLAALTGLRIEALVAVDESGWQEPPRELPRLEPRRRHLREVADSGRSDDADRARLN
jgi:hypothetical protein